MTFEKVKKILAEQLDIPADSISLETHFVEDLDADSLDVVELIMSVEDTFGISIPDEDVPELVTVEKLVEYIEANQ
ncbi:MAG: acyl carrier protein [Oscillospiraceae bacterium]|nr:acyl carrier protein [Oscillospiraceae bacterium]